MTDQKKKEEETIPSRTLDDLGITFVDLIDGYLIAANQDGLYELWCFISDENASDYLQEQGEDAVPLLEYESDLYSWGTTESDLAVLRRQIKHERGK